METEKELNAKILAVTTQIRQQHPELLPFLNEMAVTIPDESNPEITVKILKDYLNSLNTLLKKTPDHPASNKI